MGPMQIIPNSPLDCRKVNLPRHLKGSVATFKTVTEDAPRGTGRRNLRQPDRTACVWRITNFPGISNSPHTRQTANGAFIEKKIYSEVAWPLNDRYAEAAYGTPTIWQDRYSDFRRRLWMLGDWRRLRQHRGVRVHQGGQSRSRPRHQLLRYRRGVRLRGVGKIAGEGTRLAPQGSRHHDQVRHRLSRRSQLS